jgi:hypothetical protein
VLALSRGEHMRLSAFVRYIAAVLWISIGFL